MTGDQPLRFKQRRDDISLSAEHVVATDQARAARPPIDGDLIIGSDQVLELTRLAVGAIIGGGAIGCSASMLKLGTQNNHESTERLIPGADGHGNRWRAFKKEDTNHLHCDVGAKRSMPASPFMSDRTDIDVEEVIVSVGRTTLSKALA